jgi:hypothetical protein
MSPAKLLHIVNDGNAVAVSWLIVILACVGSKMVESSIAARQWGWRSSAAAFVAYSIYGSVTFHPAEVEDWIHIVIRGLLAGGLTLGTSWIVLAVLATVWNLLAQLAARSEARARRLAVERSLREEERRHVRQTQRELAAEEANRRALERQRAAVPPRAEQLRRLAEAAQADYGAEVAVLTGLPLDDDERTMLLDQAKQRLLQRLKQGTATP